MTDMITGSMPPEQIIATYWAETTRINREQALSLTKYREDKQAEAYRQATKPIEPPRPPKPKKEKNYNKPHGVELIYTHGKRVGKMYQDGKSMYFIGKELKISPKSVKRILIELGLKEEGEE